MSEQKISITYVISDIDKALAFEWIASGLDKAKFDLSFILLLQEPAELSKWCNANNIKCTNIYYKTKKDLPAILFKVFTLLRKESPTVVHTHLLYGSLIGLMAAKLAGIKKRIHTRHHSDYHHRYFPKGIKWDKICNRLATTIIAPSRSVYNVLTEMEHVDPQKIKIIHHGFDLDYFSSPQVENVKLLKKKYGTTDHFPVIGVISRFTELKGIQYIIPAYKDLLALYPDALLILFNAKGDYEQTIKKSLADLIPASNYKLVAFENDLASVYALMDMFVQVSTDKNIEAFGQTYVEALAAGVPSIFTLSGIANDFIVDKKNALVVPFKDATAIFKAMKTLMQDQKLNEELIQNGKESVREKFSVEKMIQNLELLYATN